MSVRDELFRLHDEHGELTPQLVVEAARPESHPLHSRFEWDDQKAGEAHRLDQARGLIRSLRITYRDAEGYQQHVRQFVSVARPEGRAYVPTVAVADDPLARRILLADMHREWQALKRRYGHMAEFLDMISEERHDQAG
jgi:hypothetical protein